MNAGFCTSEIEIVKMEAGFTFSFFFFT